MRDGRAWMGALGVLVAYVLLTSWFLYWYILTPLVKVAVRPGTA